MDFNFSRNGALQENSKLTLETWLKIFPKNWRIAGCCHQVAVQGLGDFWLGLGRAGGRETTKSLSVLAGGACGASLGISSIRAHDRHYCQSWPRVVEILQPTGNCKRGQELLRGQITEEQGRWSDPKCSCSPRQIFLGVLEGELEGWWPLCVLTAPVSLPTGIN